MFHIIPRVPRRKMERFAAIYGSKKADSRVETRDAADR
jgi:hypothetical protein